MDVPRRLRRWWHALYAIARRPQAERDLDDEIAFHLEREIEEQMSKGASYEEARYGALRRFAGVTQAKEACQDAWGVEPLADLWRDLKYAVRVLTRDRGYAAVAILTIALAIGASDVVFSVIDAVLLSPLRFPHAARIVAVLPRPDATAPTVNSSGPDFDDFHRASRAFESLGGVIPSFSMAMTGGGDEARVVRCTAVSPEVFRVLGMTPLIGRVFTPAEYHVDGGAVMLAEGFWRRRFGGDPRVLGRPITLNADEAYVIGVMPATPDVFNETDLWLTYIPDFVWARQRDNRFLSIIGLLKPGISNARAAAEMTAIYRRMPGVGPTGSVDVLPLHQEVTAPAAPSLLLATGAVLLVLLLACVNLATLTLARGSTRRKEIAIRLGLGASRGRVRRQLITETALFTGIGGLLGVGMAAAGVRLVASTQGAIIPRVEQARLDVGVLACSLALCSIVVVAVGVLPAHFFTRGALFDVLRMRRTDTARGSTWRAGLLVAEMAMAVVLVAGAGLLVRSLWLLEHAPLGFSPDRVLTMYLRLSDGEPWTSWPPFYTQLLETLEGRPSVSAAAVSDCLPTSHVASADLIPSGVAVDPDHAPSADACFVSPDYFQALGIPLRAGRPFDRHDRGDGAPVAIISESVARRLWPGEDPIGRRLAVNYRTLGRPTDPVPTERIVAGVVGDVRNRSLDSAAGMAVYLPFLQDPTGRSWRSMMLFVKTAGQPQDVVGLVKTDIRRLKSNVPISRVATLDEVIGGELVSRRFMAALLFGFAAFAVLLAAIGLYGVVAQSVAERTHEIGVRMALGATGTTVLSMLARRVFAVVAAGTVAGLLASWGLTRSIQQLLYGVEPLDLPSLAGAVATLIAAAAVASYVPVRRAIRVDPVVTLRAE